MSISLHQPYLVICSRKRGQNPNYLSSWFMDDPIKGLSIIDFGVTTAIFGSLIDACHNVQVYTFSLYYRLDTYKAPYQNILVERQKRGFDRMYVFQPHWLPFSESKQGLISYRIMDYCSKYFLVPLDVIYVLSQRETRVLWYFYFMEQLLSKNRGRTYVWKIKKVFIQQFYGSSSMLQTDV